MPYSPNVDYRKQARLAAQRYGLDPHIFERQIGVESIGYRPDVIAGTTASPAGAQGIAQFMPATARGLGVDPLRPVKALNAAAKLMASYVKKYGSYENALRAYNAGAGAIQASHGYAETNRYVQQILQGRDPGHLGVSRQPPGGTGRPGRGGGNGATVIPGRPPAPAALGGLNVTAPDVSGLAALLSSDTAPQRAAPTPITSPVANPYVPQVGLPVPEMQQPSQDDGLAAKLAAIGSLGGATLSAPAQPADPGIPARVIPGGSRGGVGRTLVVGDSLGVGTVPQLKRLGLNVDANVHVGRGSGKGLQVLSNMVRGRDYQNIVWDLGTNDGTAGELAKNLRRAIKLAPNAEFYVPTLNGPFQTAAKNRVLHQIAAENPNVKLVPWHSRSQGLGLSDGIHGGYGTRAGLLARELGYTPKEQQPVGRFKVQKIDGLRLTRPDTAWNPSSKPMAPWLAQALDWAHQHGWTGTVSSGYRTAAEQDVAARNYGLSHYGPGGPQASNHRSGNAVDVTNAAQLDKVLRGYKGKRPIWAGPVIRDWVHFSDNGH